MRPAIILSVILIGLSILVCESFGPIPKASQMPVTPKEVPQASPATLSQIEPLVEVMQRVGASLVEAQKIMAEDARIFAERDRVQAVARATLVLAGAIVHECTPETTMNATDFDGAIARMFMDPNDPSSPMKEHVYADLDRQVQSMSSWKTSIIRVTEDDPVFAKRPKKEWRVAHLFIRVEKVLDNGTKRVSGIIISAPEPKPGPTKEAR